MIPIHDLLHRIEWDAQFGAGDFVIGYYDRIADKIIRVPFRHVHLDRGDQFSFDAVEDDGSVHAVPFHRVREVWRNGELIWKRERAA